MGRMPCNKPCTSLLSYGLSEGGRLSSRLSYSLLAKKVGYHCLNFIQMQLLLGWLAEKWMKTKAQGNTDILSLSSIFLVALRFLFLPPKRCFGNSQKSSKNNLSSFSLMKCHFWLRKWEKTRGVGGWRNPAWVIMQDLAFQDPTFPLIRWDL